MPISTQIDQLGLPGLPRIDIMSILNTMLDDFEYLLAGFDIILVCLKYKSHCDISPACLKSHPYPEIWIFESTIIAVPNISIEWVAPTFVYLVTFKETLQFQYYKPST